MWPALLDISMQCTSWCRLLPGSRLSWSQSPSRDCSMSWCLQCRAAAAPDPSRSPATIVQHPCRRWTQRPQTTGCGCRRPLASCCWRCAVDSHPGVQPAHSHDSCCHVARPHHNNPHHCLHTVLAPETLCCLHRTGPLSKPSAPACS